MQLISNFYLKNKFAPIRISNVYLFCVETKFSIKCFSKNYERNNRLKHD